MSIPKEDFQKSLARLEGLAKSQLFHTGSDSAPGQWAGSAPTDEDSMGDDIQENGTDYDGVKKSLGKKLDRTQHLTKAEIAIIKGQNPYGFIKTKLSKGEGLTNAERWVMKGGRQLPAFQQFAKSEGMASVEKKDGAAEENKTARDIPSLNVADKNSGKEEPEANKGFPFEKDKDEDEEAKKSFAAAAKNLAQLQKGIEVSPILHELAVAIGHGFAGNEARVAQVITKSIAQAMAPVVGELAVLKSALAQQSEFNKSLAEAVVGIGAHVSGGAEVQQQQAQLPVGAPRSQLRALPGGQGQGVQPIQKSFDGPGGLESGDPAMAKSLIVGTMTDMVKAGKLPSLEVVKFEATNQLSPQVEAAVRAFAAGNRG